MPDDTIRRIEVDFAVPVKLTREQERTLHDLVDDVARAHEPAGKVHWLCHYGAKLSFSASDAVFLGEGQRVDIDPTLEAGAEPTADGSVLYLGTHCRDAHPGEREAS